MLQEFHPQDQFDIQAQFLQLIRRGLSCTLEHQTILAAFLTDLIVVLQATVLLHFPCKLKIVHVNPI
jgi:hypothetical protein